MENVFYSLVSSKSIFPGLSVKIVFCVNFWEKLYYCLELFNFILQICLFHTFEDPPPGMRKMLHTLSLPKTLYNSLMLMPSKEN